MLNSLRLFSQPKRYTPSLPFFAIRTGGGRVDKPFLGTGGGPCRLLGDDDVSEMLGSTL